MDAAGVDEEGNVSFKAMLCLVLKCRAEFTAPRVARDTKHGMQPSLQVFQSPEELWEQAKQGSKVPEVGCWPWDTSRLLVPMATKPWGCARLCVLNPVPCLALLCCRSGTLRPSIIGTSRRRA